MNGDLFVTSPNVPLWQFGYGYLQYSVRPADSRRLNSTRPRYVKIPEGPYVELKDWTEGLNAHPTFVLTATATPEVTTEAAKFIVAAHHL